MLLLHQVCQVSGHQGPRLFLFYKKEILEGLVYSTLDCGTSVEELVHFWRSPQLPDQPFFVINSKAFSRA